VSPKTTAPFACCTTQHHCMLMFRYSLGISVRNVKQIKSDRRNSQLLHGYRSNILCTLQWDVCVDTHSHTHTHTQTHTHTHTHKSCTPKQMKALVFFRQAVLSCLHVAYPSKWRHSLLFFSRPPWHYIASICLTHTSIHKNQWSVLANEIECSWSNSFVLRVGFEIDGYHFGKYVTGQWNEGSRSGCGELKQGAMALLFIESETREFIVKISYITRKLRVSKGEILRRYLHSRWQIYAWDVASFFGRTTGLKTHLFAGVMTTFSVQNSIQPHLVLAHIT
jgi:hypothetical protein